MDEEILVTFDEGDAGKRLDKALAERCDDISRVRIQALIAQGQVYVNGAPVLSAKHKVEGNEDIVFSIPEAEDADPEPENIPLNIVYEDAHLIVIDKAAGMVVHPARGHYSGTLVNALLYHCGDTLSGINGVKRPGILHRLDKDTSGLMLVAKTDQAHQKLAENLKARDIKRVYTAFVWGEVMPPIGTIEAPLGRDSRDRLKIGVKHTPQSREAITHYKRLKVYGQGTYSRVECRLETGRTHQIRVHMQHLGYPLIGDPLYGLQITGQKARLKDFDDNIRDGILGFPRQALHATELEFEHPIKQEIMNFNSNLPDEFKALD